MCDSLYVKANGKLPCWDDVGEDLVLGRLDADRRLEGRIFHSNALVGIREAFLSGRLPHPDVCSRCAVRGHGTVRTTRPTRMRVLHVEPAFLCQLACPQCLSPRQRLEVESPPYYLAPDHYDELLQHLAAEGVESIDLVHFEGRGDPLLNRDLGAMVASTKRYFPHSFVKVTSHGNFPFADWMVRSGLDLLRLSIDGAFQESYARYRVGGQLHRALDLLARIRDARPHAASPRTEWKYILFEWSDSDDEIREATRLASMLGADLRFCLTHSEGRSRRFRGSEELAEALRRLAPNATFETTFQLKAPDEAEIDHLLATHTQTLLLRALRDLRRGERESARQTEAEALRLDPGLSETQLRADGDPVEVHLEEILERGRQPGLFSALANIQLEKCSWRSAERLFRRYLECSQRPPDEPTVRRLLAPLIVGNRLGRALEEIETATARARTEAEEALHRFLLTTDGRSHELSNDPRELIPHIVNLGPEPDCLWTLAILRAANSDHKTARHLGELWIQSLPELDRGSGWDRLERALQIAPAQCPDPKSPARCDE